MPTDLPNAVSPARKFDHDKLNNVDFHWFIVRTLPHQEKKVVGMLEHCMADMENILEVYCPTRTTVCVNKNGMDIETPLFAGFVFVLSTQQALKDFMDRYYPEGTVMYERRKEEGKKACLWTIPEEQMKAFRDFNENYADKVVILERPYSDYAFNPKGNEPNEIVKVIDGPLAGKEGYLVRFRREKRMVFRMRSFGNDGWYTVSVPNIWNFHVVRLHNAEGDRQTIGTMKERAVDLLIGILQGCGYGDRTLPMLYDIVDTLVGKPSLVELCKKLYKQGHDRLSQRISVLGITDAELVLNLIRYERDNPGYVKCNWNRFVIRPFLTPTSGVEIGAGKYEAILRHTDFTESVCRVEIAEQVYYPSKDVDETVRTTYYAHIGAVPDKESGCCTLFVNWDIFLREYFMTAGKANERLVSGTSRIVRDVEADNEKVEKLIDSFRNYAPTLYRVLTDSDSNIKVIRDFKVGNETLNVMAVQSTGLDMERSKKTLISVCVNICKEINGTAHLAVWRRYLRSVWLHV